MNRRTFLLSLLTATAARRAHAERTAAMSDTTQISPARNAMLWYKQPAIEWMEALPVGNGRLGAMVFGGVAKERIQLNEESLWDGHPMERNNPETLRNLPEVRRLLFAGENKKAEELADRHLMGNPKRIKSYQTLGDLFLDFGDTGEAADYRRELDLDTGIARTTYRIGDVTFTREVFASAPDQALVVRIACDKPGRVNARVSLTRGQVTSGQKDAPNQIALRPRDDRYKANQTVRTFEEGTKRLILRGQIEDRPEGAAETWA